ncbi:MAG: CsgG/HfaB family protein [Longimicrobiales bacterium]|jgi:curli biogenesis system outer membrane secretion channel CsgG
MRIPPIVLPAAFAASLLIAAIAPVAAQDIPTVGVMDFESFMMGEGGASVQLGKAVTAMLITEFSSREGIRIVERQRINDLIREMDLSYSGRVEEAVEIGKLLGMQYVLLGAVTSIVDNLRMDIRAVDVETSEVLTAMKKSDTTNALFSVVVDLADDFGKALNLTAPSQRPEVEEIPVRATIEFSRAVTYEDEQDFEQAIEHYEATLEIYPTHRDAQLALERLRGGTKE